MSTCTEINRSALLLSAGQWMLDYYEQNPLSDCRTAALAYVAEHKHGGVPSLAYKSAMCMAVACQP